MNNVGRPTPPPSPQVAVASSARIVVQEDERPKENPFKYWQETLREKSSSSSSQMGAALKRTVSLGPRRPVGELAQKSPFLSKHQQPAASLQEQAKRFTRAANELQTSLTELNKLIDDDEKPQARNRPPRPNQPPPIHITANGNGPTPRRDRSASPPPEAAPRWQWQEDLTNWRMSSSVNDLRSAFESPQGQQLQKGAPRNKSALSVSTDANSSTCELPPAPRSASVLRNSPWQTAQTTLSSSTGGDYTIRRTTSISSSSLSSANRRPPVAIRNPYRGNY